MKTIGVGVIGNGFGAKVHAPAFRQIPGVEVVGVAGRDSWKALVDDPRVSAVSVAAAPAAHYEIVSAVLERGKHVLCEKPFGLDIEQARELRDRAVSAGVVNMIDFLFRAAPERVRLRALLQDGAIGRVLRVNVDWTMAGRAAKSPEWRWQADRDSGGGALFAFGTHVVDYLEWLVGPVLSVSARLSVCGRRPLGELHRQVAEDTVDALMVIGDGVPASVAISNAMPAAGGHWLTVHGDRGALVVGSSNLHDAVLGTALFQIAAGDGARRQIDVEPMDTSVADGRALLFHRIAETFVGAIRSGGPFSPTFDAGLRAQVVAGAVRRAHAEQRWISIA